MKPKIPTLILIGTLCFASSCANIELEAKDDPISYFWKDEDGTLLYSVENKQGEPPEYGGDSLDDKEEDGVIYHFVGWEEDKTPDSKCVIYKAIYSTSLATYDVYWLDYDGNILEEDKDVPYGTLPSFDGAIPTRASTAQYDFVFSSWDKEITPVVSRQFYRATYEESLRCYSVRWYGDNETLLEVDENVPYGTLPSFDGQTPEKAESYPYRYTFANWNKPLSPIKGDTSFHAMFNAEKMEFEIRFLGEQEELLYSYLAPYGTYPVYGGDTPTKAEDELYTYEFNGWIEEFEMVTEAKDYHASFSSISRKVKATFLDQSGNILQETLIDPGETPVYEGETPRKEDEGESEFLFVGWNIQIEPIYEDTVYVASFYKQTKHYHIRFLDENGNVLDECDVESGRFPIYTGITPTKEEDEEYRYEFVGWDSSIGLAYADKDYTAEFNPIAKYCSISFLNEDGSVLQSDSHFPIGETPVYEGEVPLKESDDYYTYSFIGWNKPLEAANKDIVYTAMFKADIRLYCITYLDYDGSILYQDYVPYLGTSTYPYDNPTRDIEGDYRYEFRRWSGATSGVTGDISVTAQYRSFPSHYDVYFLDYDGSILSCKSTLYGTIPSYGNGRPQRETDGEYDYRFIGWDPTLSPVTETSYYYAVYDRDIHIDYIEIKTVSDFYSIGNDLSGNYMLANDINLYGTSANFGTENRPFSGILEGNGHTIRLGGHTEKIRDGALFAYNAGEIRNLRLEGAYIKSEFKHDGGYNDEYPNLKVQMAALALNNSGYIHDITLDGATFIFRREELTYNDTVSNSPASLTYNVSILMGGIVCKNSGTVENCLAKNVTFKTELYLRTYYGLVGYAINSLWTSYWSKMNANMVYGGVVGENSGDVSACYSDHLTFAYSGTSAHRVNYILIGEWENPLRGTYMIGNITTGKIVGINHLNGSITYCASGRNHYSDYKVNTLREVLTDNLIFGQELSSHTYESSALSSTYSHSSLSQVSFMVGENEGVMQDLQIVDDLDEYIASLHEEESEEENEIEGETL